MAFTQADFILQACERSIEPTEEMYFDSVYTPQPNFHLDVLDDCVIALRNPAFSAVKEAIADIENQSKAVNKTSAVPTDVAAAAQMAASASISTDGAAGGEPI